MTQLIWESVDPSCFREKVADFYAEEFGRILPEMKRKDWIRWKHFLLWSVGSERALVGWHFGKSAGPDRFYLANTCILPAFRGQGIYQAAMPLLFRKLQKLGFRTVVSRHLAKNWTILHLKQKQGFRKTREDQPTAGGLGTEWSLALTESSR
ncbi:MAG: hypothetical protein JNL01_14465 [Bdellovibrionales bacterium]|nr:hypothetical protein [Bdellovibrionales bacterium]